MHVPALHIWKTTRHENPLKCKHWRVTCQVIRALRAESPPSDEMNQLREVISLKMQSPVPYIIVGAPQMFAKQHRYGVSARQGSLVGRDPNLNHHKPDQEPTCHGTGLSEEGGMAGP